MNDIKIFVSCHRPSAVPKHSLLYPIQVGSALAEEHFRDYIHDDDGENISGKNRSYCELTGQYWAWKNSEADYYGFFHYRRYLYPNEAARLPYCIEAEPIPETLKRLGYDGFETLIRRYDLLLPKKENMHISVRKHYADAPFHHEKDLNLAVQILLEQHPEYEKATELYLSGTQCYFGNIFIMCQKVFYDYCAWLFPILDEFDRRADLTSYNAQELRVNGYLAERLLGIWVCYHSELNTAELPRVYFVPNGKERRKKQIINFFLPPGSMRRALVKRRLKHGDWFQIADAAIDGIGDTDGIRTYL